jgi:hypothetical protein
MTQICNRSYFLARAFDKKLQIGSLRVPINILGERTLIIACGVRRKHCEPLHHWIRDLPLGLEAVVANPL